jgi:hypothetical protein
MAAGVILLGEVATRTPLISITCRRCDRRGRQRTDRLLYEHGPHMPMPDLLRLLATGCPKLDSHNITDRCDVHCPDLSGLFAVPVGIATDRPPVAAVGGGYLRQKSAEGSRALACYAGRHRLVGTSAAEPRRPPPAARQQAGGA